MDGSSTRVAVRNGTARSAAGGKVSTTSWAASFSMHGVLVVVAFTVPYAVLRGTVPSRRPVTLAMAPPARSPIPFEEPEPEFEITTAVLPEQEPVVLPVEVLVEPSPFPPDPTFEPIELDPFGFRRLPAETFVVPRTADAASEAQADDPPPEPPVLVAEEVVAPTPIAEPVGEESTDISPVLLEDQSPAVHYPMRARQRHQEGTVECLITVAANGRVAQVVVLCSSGYKVLDRAALEGIGRWRFRPGTRDGKAVAMDIEHNVTFVTR